MPNSELSTTFQDSYYKGDYHKIHELIKAVGPGKLWSKDFLKILKECGQNNVKSDKPEDYAQWLHDLFLTNEDTLRKVESNYDKMKMEIESRHKQITIDSARKNTNDDFFLIFALGTLKEMQHKGLFPRIIIKMDGKAKTGPIV
jgi:hypothetical protein